VFKRFSGPAWFKPGPLAGGLGRLERQVMEIVWTGGDFSVRDVQSRLPRTVAYTTVMTTLDRLYKKGLVLRRQEGRAYIYATALGRDELEARVTTDLLADVFAGRPGATRPFLSNLVEAVGDHDGRLLDDLEQLVREKRDRIKRGKP
jgi:predicted transcriptional regulator